ncbi:MAG: STY4528 family pathogenicity island replication protein [Steroidobacteraceae bacterium]
MSPSTSAHPGVLTPQALLVDKRLTPLERNAWLAFRFMAGDDGTVVASYESLRDYLSVAPGSRKGALETVARAVLCLRLSTWIALVEYRRSPMTGFSLASRYLAREEPLAFDEACRADDDYLPLLERALGHSSATVRHLARGILEVALCDPDALARLPTGIQERIRLLKEKYYGDRPDDSGDPPPCSDPPSSACPRSPDIDVPKHAPTRPATVRTTNNRSVNTYCTEVPPQSEVPAITLKALDRFHHLLPKQQRYLTTCLKRLHTEQRQAVLEEWNVRCDSGAVRDAAAYLYGLIERALGGEFHPRAARKVAPALSSAGMSEASHSHQGPIHSQYTLPASSSESGDVGRKYLDEMKRKVGKPEHASEVINKMVCNGALSRPPTVLSS